MHGRIIKAAASQTVSIRPSWLGFDPRGRQAQLWLPILSERVMNGEHGLATYMNPIYSFPSRSSHSYYIDNILMVNNSELQYHIKAGMTRLKYKKSFS